MGASQTEPSPAQAIESVLARAGLGDHAAWQELHSLYGKRIYWFFVSRCRSEDDAKDLTQDVFAYAFQMRASLPPADRLAAWLMTQAGWRFKDWLRKRKNAPLPLSDLPLVHEPTTCSSPDDQVLAERAYQAILSLPDSEAQILCLDLIEDMSHPEISRATGLHVSEVKNKARRGLAELRRRLGVFRE